MVFSSIHTLFVVLVLVSLILQESAHAFQPVVGRLSKETITSALAWALQAPDIPFPKGTWYDDVGNPTFRRQVFYDDDNTEFRFTNVGSSWPDYDAIEKEAVAAAAEAKSKPRKAIRIRPLQRVRNLINHSRRP